MSDRQQNVKWKYIISQSSSDQKHCFLSFYNIVFACIINTLVNSSISNIFFSFIIKTNSLLLQMSQYAQNSSFQKTVNPNSRHYTWTQYGNQNAVDVNYLHPSKYQQSHNTSPFTNKRHIRQQSSGLDSIENLIDSRQSSRRRASFDKKQYASYQSQEIAFLKEKLIQTHNKLLKQLQNNNKIESQKQNLIRDLKSNQRTMSQLQDKIRTLQHQLDQTNRLLSHRVQKNEQKYKSVENKLQDQSKKNYQLKQDLQSVRNKMLETIMEKNMLQQANVEFKQNLKNAERNNTELQGHLRQRDEHITILQKQNGVLNNKCSQMDKQIVQKNRNISQLEKIVNQKKGAEKQLQHLCKMEQQKNANLLHDLSDLESQNSHLLNRIKQLEKQSEKQKQQIYWLQNNNEKTNRNLNQQIEKLTEELEAMNVMYREVESQLNFLRNKPLQQAQKKRRHYQITRQFVNQLENQQQLYGNSGSRGTSHKNTNLKSPPTQPVTSIKTSIGYKKPSPPKSSFTNINKSAAENQRNYGYFQSKTPSYKAGSNSYANLMKEQSGYQQEKNKYISNLSDVGELEGTLFNCNLERKKLKAEIQRIDQNKVKTREMIVKKKKFEEQLQFQEKKIQKLKQQLRKLRAN